MIQLASRIWNSYLTVLNKHPLRVQIIQTGKWIYEKLQKRELQVSFKIWWICQKRTQTSISKKPPFQKFVSFIDISPITFTALLFDKPSKKYEIHLLIWVYSLKPKILKKLGYICRYRDTV